MSVTPSGLPGSMPSGQATVGSLTRVRNAAVELVNAIDAHMAEVAKIGNEMSALMDDGKEA